jgi:uncharacterized membrane-anchored protein
MSFARTALAALALLLSFTLAHAQERQPQQSGKAARDAEIDAAFSAALKNATAGPADVALIDQAVLKLPEGYVWVAKADGERLMQAFGNRTGQQFVGLVLPAREIAWFVTLDYVKSGYVKDDDAKEWNADDLLKALREGTEAGNEDRVARGFPPVEVTGWVEPPTYSAETHRLVWAANLRRKGTESGGSVNYNTYALGREGYFELNLVGSGETVTREKGRAKELLAALQYNKGKAYTDFQPGVDKVAEFGLAALIAGAAAKKLGLFAMAAVFLAKAWKLVLVGVLAFGGLFSKLFGKKKQPPAA